MAIVALTAATDGAVDAVTRELSGPAAGAPTRGAGGARPSDDKRRADEARLKAAFLYNFLKYAEFPEEAFDDDGKEKKKSPLVVLVVGEDALGDALETTFDGKKLGSRAIVVRRTKTRPKEIDAHLVFTKGLDRDEEAKLIEQSRGKHCILVGDDPGFAERGGFINFYMSKRKPRFEVNVARQEDTGVELSASLLKLAKVVEEKEPEKKKKKKKKRKDPERGGDRDGRSAAPRAARGRVAPPATARHGEGGR